MDRNKTNILVISIAVVVLVAVLLIFLLAGNDDTYEQGNEALRNQDYNEALAYYQKVDADDPNFKLAQSRINYIYGIRAYNEGKMDEARVYLAKINPADEYYQGAVLILEKLSSPVLQDTMRTSTKDTVIIREQLSVTQNNKQPVEKEKQPVNPGDAHAKYITALQSNINSFQSLYQSAYSATVENKRNIVKNMTTVAGKLSSIPYNTAEKNPEVLTLKDITNDWMQRRINFINKLIDENSVRETNSTRSLKEEGDKNYNMVTNQLTKVKRLYGL